MKDSIQPSMSVCLMCGNDLPEPRRKYCSDECQRDVNREYQRKYFARTYHGRPRPSKRACANCGRLFIAPSTHLYCSVNCRWNAQQRRRRAAQKRLAES